MVFGVQQAQFGVGNVVGDVSSDADGMALSLAGWITSVGEAMLGSTARTSEVTTSRRYRLADPGLAERRSY